MLVFRNSMELLHSILSKQIAVICSCLKYTFCGVGQITMGRSMISIISDSFRNEY